MPARNFMRIFKLPEFTYFTHKAHVRFGLACQACHGPIERMRVVGAETGPSLTNDLMNLIGLKPPPRPLTSTATRTGRRRAPRRPRPSVPPT